MFDPIEQFKKFQQFSKESWGEIKKVSWPARKETIASTVAVIVSVLLIATFLGLVDLLLSKVVGGVIKYGNLR
ncbi:MAG: preprotein translocase subunit SecE [Nitrospinae bacterium]|nr:preprotein translocase subunit SecE [Nitrospinota bacterium]